MNILMLGQWLPSSLHAADTRRAYHFARCLTGSHRLTLAFVTDDPNPFGSISALRSEFGDLEFSVVPRGWKRFWGALRLATGRSATVAYFRSGALHTRLRDRLRGQAYDLVYVSSSSMIQYTTELDPSVPVVMDFGDVDSERWMQRSAQQALPWAAMCGTEALRLREAEIAMARRAARCLVATREAAAILGSFAPWAPTTVIPNGVDLDEHTPPPQPAATPTIVFNALQDNGSAQDAADFCRDVLPAVSARVPGARLVIVSKEAGRSVKRLARRAGVELAAPVTDIRPFLQRAAVAVAPIRRSQGVQLSILEAMAAGVPVVTTSRGHEGLAARAGRDIHVADDTEAFSLRVIELLESPALRAEIGARGRSFVTQHHSWGVAATRLMAIVDGVAQRSRPAAKTRVAPLSGAIPQNG